MARRRLCSPVRCYWLGYRTPSQTIPCQRVPGVFKGNSPGGSGRPRYSPGHGQLRDPQDRKGTHLVRRTAPLSRSFHPNINIVGQLGGTIFWPGLGTLDQAQFAPQHSRTAGFHERLPGKIQRRSQTFCLAQNSGSIARLSDKLNTKTNLC